VLNGDDVLLIKRASHMRVFPNRYNGLGGHIERYEDPLSSARREIFEESGLVVTDLSLRAVYNIDAGGSTGIILFVFTAYSASRNFNPVCDEGALYWIPRSKLLELIRGRSAPNPATCSGDGSECCTLVCPCQLQFKRQASNAVCRRVMPRLPNGGSINV
jgi:8-oxo-dGTP pyrophosphatase MutT (NUDIX family)